MNPMIRTMKKAAVALCLCTVLSPVSKTIAASNEPLKNELYNKQWRLSFNPKESYILYDRRTNQPDHALHVRCDGERATEIFYERYGTLESMKLAVNQDNTMPMEITAPIPQKFQSSNSGFSLSLEDISKDFTMPQGLCEIDRNTGLGRMHLPTKEEATKANNFFYRFYIDLLNYAAKRAEDCKRQVIKLADPNAVIDSKQFN